MVKLIGHSKWVVAKSLLAILILFLNLIATAHAAPSPRIKPAAPAPVYLSQMEADKLEAFFEALDSRRWSTANRLRGELSDTVAVSIANWAWYRKNPEDLNYSEAGTFLQSHLDWPSGSLIQRQAEKRIPFGADAASVKRFFQERKPVTGTGNLRLAQAYFETSDPEAAALYLRDAWVKHDWSSSQEKTIIREYGAYLTPSDHAAKADRQLFEIKATNTKRLLPYLGSRDRRMAEARIALLRNDRNARTLFNNLDPDEKMDSGVLHAVTRHFRRNDEEKLALQYARRAPLDETQIRNTDRWWTEKRLLARWALKNGLYEDAYAMTAYTGLISGSAFAQAEFEAGWIALRFLNDPQRAHPHFSYLNSGVTAPISVARAQYWLGRSFTALGDTERAQQHFKRATEYPLTYYGQLAYEQVLHTVDPPLFPQNTLASPEEQALFDARPLVYAMRVLAELGRDFEFIVFARELDDQLDSPGEYAIYEEFMENEGKIFLSVRAGKVAVGKDSAAPSVAYPIVYVPDEAKGFAETALILGLSRQESEFNPRAFSSAKARGMMQLLPSTAQITARKEGIPYYRSRLLDDPSYNMIIGAAHLKHLQDRFEGSYIMTLAAYNAGPHRVDRWVREYGDPRSPNIDPVDWVELIPFGETRNYVQRVMENVQIYRARLGDQPIAGRLSEDLIRGGGTRTAIGINPASPVLASMAKENPAPVSTFLPASRPAAFAFEDGVAPTIYQASEQQQATLPMALSEADRLMLEQMSSSTNASAFQQPNVSANDTQTASGTETACDTVQKDDLLTADELNAAQLLQDETSDDGALRSDC